ncbi:hypothetical protein PR048_008809 [Dryococelus australis]|uniref:Uncharacterized protein n=1 Tax=Dryococelus australis TaxID=614101 RepID=A0ABQ9HY68_9NEOP|nr:hypothetical protein PR048_008809 [Dryococelus australis]
MRILLEILFTTKLDLLIIKLRGGNIVSTENDGTERGGAMVTHCTRIWENPGSIPGPAILISVFHDFPKSLQANVGMGPLQSCLHRYYDKTFSKDNNARQDGTGYLQNNVERSASAEGMKVSPRFPLCIICQFCICFVTGAACTGVGGGEDVVVSSKQTTSAVVRAETPFWREEKALYVKKEKLCEEEEEVATLITGDMHIIGHWWGPIVHLVIRSQHIAAANREIQRAAAEFPIRILNDERAVTLNLDFSFDAVAIIRAAYQSELGSMPCGSHQNSLPVWDGELLAPAHFGPCAQFRDMPLLAPVQAPTCNYVQQTYASEAYRKLNRYGIGGCEDEHVLRSKEHIMWMQIRVAYHKTSLCSQKTPMTAFCTAHRMRGRGKREIPEETRRPTTLSDTIPTCENPATRPGIGPGSPWWEASRITAQPPWPHSSA